MEGLIALGYMLTCLIAARIVYTKYVRGQWMPREDEYDQVTMAVVVSAFWPVALIVWLGYKFITGGVKSE